MARTYNQDCVLAHAMDILGERWTMLIMRELMLGPRRFGDLHAALPGIGTNLLSKRLRELEEAGLVLASQTARGSYRLSDDGEELRPTLRAMVKWAVNYFMKQTEPSPPRDAIFSNDLQPDSVALALEMFVNHCGAPHGNYVLRVTLDDNPYTFFMINDEMTARRGADAPAAAHFETGVATMMRAMRGEIFMDEIMKASRASGDKDAVRHFLASALPGAAVAFEVSELIKARRRDAAAQAARLKESAEAP